VVVGLDHGKLVEGLYCESWEDASMGGCWLVSRAGSADDVLCWMRSLRFVRGMGKVIKECEEPVGILICILFPTCDSEAKRHWTR